METLRTATTDQLTLNEINAHERDKYIKFVDTKEMPHTYLVEGYDNIKFTSVTTVLKVVKQKFDTEEVSARCASSTRKSSKYYNKTAVEIKKMWEMASTLGTRMHLIIEFHLNKIDYKHLVTPPTQSSASSTSYNGEDFVYYDVTKEIGMWLKYAEDTDIMRKIYRTEWMIWSSELEVAGSIDAIIKHDDGTYGIIDWKRSEKVDARGDKKMKYPLDYLDDCKYIGYGIQLNVYKYILENYYGLRISTLELVICHPINSTYKRIFIPTWTETAELLLSSYKKFLYRIDNNATKPSHEQSTDSTTKKIMRKNFKNSERDVGHEVSSSASSNENSDEDILSSSVLNALSQICGGGGGRAGAAAAAEKAYSSLVPTTSSVRKSFNPVTLHDVNHPIPPHPRLKKNKKPVIVDDDNDDNSCFNDSLLAAMNRINL